MKSLFTASILSLLFLSVGCTKDNSVVGTSTSQSTSSVLTQAVPSFVINSPTLFCYGTPATLSVSPQQPTGTTYLWNTGSTGSSISIMANGLYKVTVTDINGSWATKSKQVNFMTCNCMNPPLVNGISAPNQVVVNNAFTVTATLGGSATGGTWSVVNGSNLGQFASPNALTTTFMPTTTGQIIIRFTTNNPIGAPCLPGILSKTVTVNP